MLHLNHKTARSQLVWIDLLRLYRARNAEDAAISYGMMLGSGLLLSARMRRFILSLYQSKREEFTVCLKVGF
jgi:hypothetical protein